MNAQQALFVYVGAFVDELARAGVRDVCVCPGSRSAPLALMIARHPALHLWMHIDERSAAFFALGMAKAKRAPVALVCTSGTAAANFLPAVVEARLARVPLLVLTADRPAELRDNGAPQAIDQLHLYGRHVKWFAELALPECTEAALRYARTMAARATATARDVPAGPVHLNFPFREPLIPLPPDEPALLALSAAGAERARRAGEDAPYVAVAGGRREVTPAVAARLRGTLAATERGLIICGPQDDPALAPAVLALAAALGYPVLADPLSGVRCGPHWGPLVIDSYDAFLRDPAFVAGHAPDVVLRFGAMPTAKPLLQYLQCYPACHQIVVDGAAGWNEPTQLASELIYADAVALCEAVGGEQWAVGSQQGAASGLSEWSQAWIAANQRARAVLAARLEGMAGLFEGKVFAELARLLPAGATLFAGSSMPVRDLDTFFPGGARPVRFLANRGANGIDGVVSSALGASTAGAPLVLVIGDLSFYHDLNGLLASKLHKLRATIVLLNNDGGGIFSFLPQATETDGARFEQLFGTPTGLDFQPAVEMYGGRFLRPTTWEQFRAAVRSGLAGDGLTVVEVRTDRAQNVADHRALWPAVSAAVADGSTEYRVLSTEY